MGEDASSLKSSTKFAPAILHTCLRWDNETLRFSDKNQKAIDLLRTRCLRLSSLVLSDGRLYEIMRGNFERADRRSVIRSGRLPNVVLSASFVFGAIAGAAAVAAVVVVAQSDSLTLDDDDDETAVAKLDDQDEVILIVCWLIFAGPPSTVG